MDEGCDSKEKTTIRGSIDVDFEVTPTLNRPQNVPLRMDLLNIVIGATLLFILGWIVYTSSYVINTKNAHDDI